MYLSGNAPKNVKQVIEKIPGFENATDVKKEEEAENKIESRVPLTEKQINGIADCVQEEEECAEIKSMIFFFY